MTSIKNSGNRLKILIGITVIQVIIILYFSYVGFIPQALTEHLITQFTIGALVLTLVSMVVAEWQGMRNAQKIDEILTEVKKINNAKQTDENISTLAEGLISIIQGIDHIYKKDP